VINLLPVQLKEGSHRGKKLGAGIILFVKVQSLRYEGTNMMNMNFVFVVSYPGEN